MTDQPKRTRRINSDLGPGDAADRIVNVESNVETAVADGIEAIRAGFEIRQRAILARVPADLRERCIGMIASQSPELAEKLSDEIARTKARPVIRAGDAHPSESATNLGPMVGPDRSDHQPSDRITAEPPEGFPPMPRPIEGPAERRARK